MKSALIAPLLFVLVSLTLAVSTSSAQVERAAPAQPREAVPIRAQKNDSNDPSPSTTLTAAGAVSRSAACCKKACTADSTHCGKECTVVKSLSECAGEAFNNISFECSANKGMTCTGSSCSCQ